MPALRTAALAGLAIVTAALAFAEPSDTERPEYAQAKEVAVRLLANTRVLLERELQDRGPVGALRACSQEAAEESRRLEREGWRVRRVSLRARNPADAPEPDEAAVLRLWQRRHRARALPPETENVAVVNVDGRRALRYLKPIVIPGETCLHCHGKPERLDPEARRVLRQLYPRDRATGYEVGDLRGAVSVTVPLGAEAQR